MKAASAHRRLHALAMLLACVSAPALAQGAGGLRLFASDDADDTQVARAALGAHWHYTGPGQYRGLELESVHVRFANAPGWQDKRAYFAFADGEGAWTWNGRVGTDGHTALGSASLVREPGADPRAVRHEYFIERDILETPLGADGLYHTFLGAAYDFPLDADANQQITALVGAQEFTGDNVRAHLRARYIAVVKPEWGLSLQLRARAFHSSHPGEYDYYSPRAFYEAMPVVQIRRHVGQGWALGAAAGWGRQRDSGRAWDDAGLFEASVTSPRREGRGFFRAGLLYSNAPSGTGGSYGYRQASLEWMQPF